MILILIFSLTATQNRLLKILSGGLGFFNTVPGVSTPDIEKPEIRISRIPGQGLNPYHPLKGAKSAFRERPAVPSLQIPSPGFKSDILHGKTGRIGRNLPLHRISVAVTLSYYSRQLPKMQPLLERFFQIFCGFSGFFQMRRLLCLEAPPAAVRKRENRGGRSRPVLLFSCML